jgi:ribonuclease HI
MKNIERNTRVQPTLVGLGVSTIGHNKITVFCDGYFKASDGSIATWSWVAISADGQTIESNRGCVGSGEGMSMFVAGYTAIINALDWIKENEPDTPIELCIDLELVVNQISGAMKCNAKHLRPLCDEASMLMGSTKAELRWIPGALNKRAKALSRLEYQEQLAKGRIQ